MENLKKIGTHNGVFHADETLCTVILNKLAGKELQVIRTRDEKVLQECDFIFDVSTKGTKNPYDHHDADKEQRENGIPYSACGLIWRDFGRDLLRSFIESEEDVEKVWLTIDRSIIEGVDALDNGVENAKGLYNPLNISQIVSGFNPTWDSQESQDEAFKRAVAFATTVFDNLLNAEIAKVKAKGIVAEAYSSANNQIMVLKQFCPWVEHLLSVDTEEKVLFVVFQDSTGSWRIQTVPKESGSFVSRKSLPAEWAGKREKDLNEVTGISDGIFCHPGRFIAGTCSKESAVKLAALAVLTP